MNKGSIKISRQETLSTLLKLPLRKCLYTLSKKHMNLGLPQLATYSFDYIGTTVAIDGVYEIRELDLIKHFLECHYSDALEGVCLDIGANIGNHSIYFAKLFNQVRAFEPNPYPFKLLAINTEDYQNVAISNFGLSDQSGSASFFTSRANIGGSSLHGAGDNEIQVQLKTLDELDLDRESVSFIKMDVEGNELQALKGGVEFLSACQPIIAFEQHAHEFAQGESPVIRQLRDFGYTNFYCIKTSPLYIKPWMPFKNIVRLIHQLLFGGEKLLVRQESFPADFYPLIVATK